jgi:hypothetical protein
MKNLSNKSIVLLGILLAAALVLAACGVSEEEEGKAKIRNSGQILPEVVSAPAGIPVTIPAAAGNRFTPQVRMGFTEGDQWEPAIASDRSGHIYILYPQYQGVPGCPTCFSPTMILLISSDHGATWSAPAIIYPAGQTEGQWDAQIEVDPVDGSTVYASWLQNNKSDIAVAKSTDYGATWSVVIADSTNAGTDKPILVIHGQDVYVGYNHSQTVWVSSSHDGGATFTSTKVNTNAKLGWSLAGGGAIGNDGSIYYSWAGYAQNGGAKGSVNLYVSKSSDGGNTWTNTLIDTSGAPPDCSAFSCGWAFLGAQMTMTNDSSGNLYLLWNAGSTAKGPERIYFAKSTNNGQTWSAKADVSTAPTGTSHAFPAVAATGNGDVRISWMDTRTGSHWNVFYRNSTNGGSSWSSEADLSTYVAGYSYIFAEGFSFPFGDYFEMTIDENGTTHAVWGEGLSYDSPGSIWYVRGK